MSTYNILKFFKDSISALWRIKKVLFRPTIVTVSASVTTASVNSFKRGYFLVGHQLAVHSLTSKIGEHVI